MSTRVERAKEKRFVLDGCISAQDVAEIQNCLDEPNPDHVKLVIVLRNNSGGDIASVFELINSIRYSDVQVSISAHGHLISAAAVLYFYLLLNQEDADFSNVTICPLISELLVVIHRPRKEEGDYIKFAKDIPEDISLSSLPANLGERTRHIDELFRDILKHLGYPDEDEIKQPTDEALAEMTHVSDHIRKIYRANGDFVFKYTGTAKPSNK